MPWARVVEKVPVQTHNENCGIKIAKANKVSPTSIFRTGVNNFSNTLGWRPTCSCGHEDAVPSKVLDPFCGSGTTLLVARKLGRIGIGTDLSFQYLRDQARKRLGLDKLAAWGSPALPAEARLGGLPMFEEAR